MELKFLCLPACSRGRMRRVPPAFLAYYISTLLHGHFYDGEGAPLLRPLARLTSFGGYVATTIYQLPSTHYQLLDAVVKKDNMEAT